MTGSPETLSDLDTWHTGRIALVGDAGYCASSLSGQGADLSLVGAYTLAGELATAASEPNAEAEDVERSTDPRIETAFEVDYGPAMPESARTSFAEGQIGEVWRQLLDAAAFGKSISPERLPARDAVHEP
jgi:2-polyprenyl-6-methoxyphenol hydroxylase-like FAD-dependent oxidoreductase